jgi:predicted dehydrogenase
LDSAAGREWAEASKKYAERGIVSGPMHYPTHSTSGPICVMKAHALKVSAFAYYNRTGDEYFGKSPSDETALFLMSNGATMRICEYREIGLPGRETFRVYGTKGSFENGNWVDKQKWTSLTVEEMRDPLPPEVAEAFKSISGKSDFYGGHGGSHAYLVNEFVDAVANERTPAVNVWEAARYMAAGVTAHKSALKDGEPLEVPDWGDAPA